MDWIGSLSKAAASCYALSALDASSEASVQETLNDLQNEKAYTTLVIGHVFSNIQRADKIVVVSAGGSIVDKGTHSEVCTCRYVCCGLFKKSVVVHPFVPSI